MFERFFDRLSEIQKAELRTALGQCSRDVARMANGHVGVGNFRCVPESCTCWTGSDRGKKRDMVQRGHDRVPAL